VRYTIELPDDLAHKLEARLQEHHNETISSLVCKALEGIELLPKEGVKLLELAGIVADAPHHAGDRAEDKLD